MDIQTDSKKRMVFQILIVLLACLWVVGVVYAAQGQPRKAPGFLEIWKLPRIWVSALFCLAGLLLLARFWVTHRVRLIALVIIAFTFGVLYILPLGSFARGMSMHPSPFCIIEKPFLFMEAGRGVPIIFLSILTSVLILSIIGNKLFCGWVCPIGAVQEIVYRVPFTKKIKMPFRFSNAVRIGLFVLFIILVFAIGFSLYAYTNPFEFLHFGWQPLAIVMFAVVLIAALFIFRPFCYLVCPLGLLTWFAEHISIFRVRLDKEKCTDCKICVKESPCPTIPAILDEKKSRPDCHPCGRCIEVCPEKALAFRTLKKDSEA